MFVSVDTVSIDEDKNEAAAMKELLESELVAAGDEAWKIVIGHFPCHSGKVAKCHVFTQIYLPYL